MKKIDHDHQKIDHLPPFCWRFFTFDWLDLTSWVVQLQLLLTELTGVAIDAT